VMTADEIMSVVAAIVCLRERGAMSRESSSSVNGSCLVETYTLYNFL
jgi:hypothetical protein